MSIDRRCDGCDDRITSLETRAAIRVSGITATIHATLGQGAKTRLDLCESCWHVAVTAVEQHTAPERSPQSTEPRRESTPDPVEAATAWLLSDHDERVTTGIVRPASERAAELVDVIRAADAAQPIPAVDIPAWREMGESCGG